MVWDPEENDDGASESRAADVVRRATGLSRCAAGAAAEALERARFICRTLYHSGAWRMAQDVKGFGLKIRREDCI